MKLLDHAQNLTGSCGCLSWGLLRVCEEILIAERYFRIFFFFEKSEVPFGRGFSLERVRVSVIVIGEVSKRFGG